MILISWGDVGRKNKELKTFAILNEELFVGIIESRSFAIVEKYLLKDSAIFLASVIMEFS